MLYLMFVRLTGSLALLARSQVSKDALSDHDRLMVMILETGPIVTRRFGAVRETPDGEHLVGAGQRAAPIAAPLYVVAPGTDPAVVPR